MIRRTLSESRRQELLERTIDNIQEAGRVQGIMEDAHVLLQTYDAEFTRKTGLTKTDWAFLFVATALQILRQYLLTRFPERQDDQKAAQDVKDSEKEHSDRHHRYYNPSLDEIVTNPVPFDANVGSGGALGGGGSFGHRGKTLGHDPILGLIFGTANIATSTLTTTTFESYHIVSGVRANGGVQDVFGNRADTIKVLQYSAQKMLNEGIEGCTKIAASLVKEIVHLRSDMYSKKSLPLPIIETFSPKAASFLAQYGLDMGNVAVVGKQATYAILINQLIAMLHAMFNIEADPMEMKLYQVRTRKILLYSNLIATSSNIAVVAITNNFKLLDIGGLAVTLWRLISDLDFIESVREDFIAGRFEKLINGIN